MMRFTIPAIILATLAVSTLPASAQDSVSTKVRVADLDLSQPTGIAKLQHRVIAAVEKVCTPEEWEDGPIVEEIKECKASAAANAEKQVAMILDHTGRLAASGMDVESASR